MPYISQELRDELAVYRKHEFAKLAMKIGSPGELNYAITTLVLAYCRQQSARGTTSYSIYNAVLGVLDAVAREFYRREVAPYEDRKIAENGDVY